VLASSSSPRTPSSRRRSRGKVRGGDELFMGNPAVPRRSPEDSLSAGAAGSRLAQTRPRRRRPWHRTGAGTAVEGRVVAEVARVSATVHRAHRPSRGSDRRRRHMSGAVPHEGPARCRHTLEGAECAVGTAHDHHGLRRCQSPVRARSPQVRDMAHDGHSRENTARRSSSIGTRRGTTPTGGEVIEAHVGVTATRSQSSTEAIRRGAR